MTVFNPGRRSRNIGTSRQGHGQNNRLVIPSIAGSARSWSERLRAHRKLTLPLKGRDIVFFVEETTSGCRHACTPEDILHVLAHVPLADWHGLQTFVFRQSTHKQRLMNPAWGRMFYYAELGVGDQKARKTGPAVFLEAINFESSFKWRTSLQPDDLAELNRLRADGHSVERVGHHYVVSSSAESVRATQLYRTLLHEIGHYVDWLQKVERPWDAGSDYGALSEAYFQRPKDEREAFAHRYADEMGDHLRRLGVIPFQAAPDV